MAKSPKRDKTREKSSIIAARNRRELIAAGLGRRDLLKMGLLTSAGMLIPKLGLSARPLTSAGYLDDTPQSRPTRSFIEEMPRLQIKQPVADASALTGPDPQAAPNTLGGESRTVAHQAFAQFPPQKYYEMHQKAFQAKSSPDFVQPTTLWGFDGIFPGPLFVARYGEPILVRQFNDLPAENDGFGINSTTTHLHNGHTPSESDGYPCFFNPSGKFYDHHYPNVLAGVNSTHIAQGGDIRESMHSLWYHDHRIDFTAQNVYKGLAGMYNLFHPENSAYDTGNENTGFRLPSFPDYDINMVFNDAVYDAETDQLAFDLFNLDGILGDKMLVNGKIKPVLHVSPRRYRFRWLNMGPSRFYQMAVLDPTNNSSKPFWQISVDGNLLKKPVLVTGGCRISVAERVGVIVDFTGLQGKTFYLVNRMEQDDGRGPEDDLLSVGQGDRILKIVVDGPVVADNSINPANIPASQEVYFYDFPDTLPAPRVTRTFEFERNNGQWAVNGKFAACEDIRFRIKRNTVEHWIFQNNSGGWQHPIHMHFEEFQTLRINERAPRTSGIIEAGRKDVLRLEHNMQGKLFFRFRDFVGKYPIHCHNVVHEDHAMMVLLEIDDTGDLKTNP
ncbi:MAG TPA: multicopper oxidase domain-containing protein [Pyrinomonadaceae bacterium]|nr:multicopper oxidase domain-containing protein [Pyrinomonadaceae bacterium]